MRPKRQNSFFQANFNLLKLAGLWIPDQGETPFVSNLYWFYNIITNGFSIGIFMPSEFLAFGSSIENMNNFIKNASVAMTHLLAGYKVYVWLKNRKKILSIIDVLGEKALQYRAIRTFHPQLIIREEKSLKNKTTVVFLTLAAGVSITAFIGAVLIFLGDYGKYESYRKNERNLTQYRYTQRLPYWSWVPFDYTQSRSRFLLALFYTCFAPFQQAWVIVGIDTLFTTLISYISAQLRILRGAFKTIRVRSLQLLDTDENLNGCKSQQVSAVMAQELNTCIKHLQEVYSACQKMEDIFKYLTLAQVLMSEAIICTCLFLVSSIPITSKAFATELVYLLAIELQIALYCFFGSKVTFMGEDIPTALYEGDWLSANVSFRKSMLITMTRMKKPIYLTMGKFSPLTLATFVTIGKGSYSIFAVLKNQNG